MGRIPGRIIVILAHEVDLLRESDSTQNERTAERIARRCCDCMIKVVYRPSVTSHLTELTRTPPRLATEAEMVADWLYCVYDEFRFYRMSVLV